ncbi:hypothetical protein EWE75_23055 [Sphingomonas populi]|uniref:Uncharacterized protein n=1 Tax=Sphingomonas populi TaxID=2484750 RepID=A0A4Q6XPC7_9SPHN|nr:hypothetical protein [Sphingomonas populi]RZF59184.1 hypothetical protein EWE75_23055 [Sphingomonas populi]
MTVLLSLVAICCSSVAVLLLWMAWRRDHRRRRLLAGSLIAWVIALTLWTTAFGLEVGIPLTLETAAIVAFVFILSRIEFRTPRIVRERYAPPVVRSRNRWLRGTILGVGAGPVAFTASTGVGVLFATTAPLADATRLMLAGLLIPSLWGAAMTLVLASRRLLLPSAGLLGVAITTIATSVMVVR